MTLPPAAARQMALLDERLKQTTSGRWDPFFDGKHPPAPLRTVSRKNAEDRVRKAARKEGLHAGLHLENDQLEGLWYLTQMSGRYQFRLKASCQTLERLVDRFEVIRPGEVLAKETTQENN